jgi:hypothetical protein
LANACDLELIGFVKQHTGDEILLFTTAMPKALDQRNVVVYDALSHYQKTMSLSSQSSLPVLLSSSISIVMAKAGKNNVFAVLVCRLYNFVTSMMRE